MAKITREQQEQMDLIRRGPSEFVSPGSRNDAIQVPNIPSFAGDRSNAVIQTQIKTSKIDDARAFTMKAWWISIVVALGTFAIMWLAGANSTLMIVAIIVSFCITYLVTHYQHMTLSPENIARYNAKRHWDNVDKVYNVMIDKYKKDHGLE